MGNLKDDRAVQLGVNDHVRGQGAGEGLIDSGVTPPGGAGAGMAAEQQVLRLVIQGPGPVDPADSAGDGGEPPFLRPLRYLLVVQPRYSVILMRSSHVLTIPPTSAVRTGATRT
jgi:hypothetical protein